MTLLFDHNLSPRLVSRLADCFPRSLHVYSLGLAEADDQTIWNYARQHSMTIVTRDSDYNELLTYQGFPPKVVWIRRGNCSTAMIESILRKHQVDIQALIHDSVLGLLTLY